MKKLASLFITGLILWPGMAVPREGNPVTYYAVDAATGATTVETAITLTKSSGNSATSSAASFVVGTSAGRNYRITSITFGTRGNLVATSQTTTFSIRINTGGAVTTTSTPIILKARTSNGATAVAVDRVSVPLPSEGLTVRGDGTLEFGVTVNSTYTTNAPTVDVLITGYEF